MKESSVLWTLSTHAFMDFGFKFLNQRTTGSMCLLGKSEPKKGPFWVLGVYWGSQNKRTSGSEYLERREEPPVPGICENFQNQVTVGSHTLWANRNERPSGSSYSQPLKELLGFMKDPVVI